MNARRIFFGDATRSAGNDDPADASEPVGRRVDRKHVTLNAYLSHSPREQMTILPARIQNRNSLHELNYTGYFSRNRFMRSCASADTRRSAMASTVRCATSLAG